MSDTLGGDAATIDGWLEHHRNLDRVPADLRGLVAKVIETCEQARELGPEAEAAACRIIEQVNYRLAALSTVTH